MKKIIISASILQEDYDSFHSMLNEELPPTHSEWLAKKTMEDGKHTANGAIINKVVIHPQEYADYCRDSGLDTNLVTLEGFAINKKSREEIAGESNVRIPYNRI